MWHLGVKLAHVAAKAAVFCCGVHGVVIGAGAAFIAVPNPKRRLYPTKWSPADNALSFESLRLADGCHAWLVKRSDGKDSSEHVICLCHGRSRCKAWMGPLIRVLSTRYTVLAFDFKGHGENPYGVTSLGYREADSVDHALDLLEERGFTKILLYGCSMGGSSALISQSRRAHPAVRGIATHGTFAAFTEIVERRGGRFPPYCVNAALTLAGWIAGYDAWAVRPVDCMPGIRVPVCLLHGDSDSLVPPSHAERLANGNARAQVRIFPGGHDEPDNPAMHTALFVFASSVM